MSLQLSIHPSTTEESHSQSRPTCNQQSQHDTPGRTERRVNTSSWIHWQTKHVRTIIVFISDFPLCLITSYFVCSRAKKATKLCLPFTCVQSAPAAGFYAACNNAQWRRITLNHRPPNVAIHVDKMPASYFTKYRAVRSLGVSFGLFTAAAR